MKRQLPITSLVDEPQRNVRSRNPSTLSMPRQSTVSLEESHANFQPGVQSMAPNLHANHESPTSVSGENISSSSDTPQGLQALAGSTSPRVCVQCGGLMSYLDERGNSLSSEIPPPASDPLVPSTAPNLRSNIPASEERSVSLPSTSPVDEPQRNVRSHNPFARSAAPHFRVFTQQERQRVASLEQPHGFQPGVQSVVPNMHANHQGPISVPGESISGSSVAPQSLQALAGSTAPHVFEQNQSLISAPDEMGISLSSEVPPPASDPLVPSTVPYIVNRMPTLRSLFLNVAPPLNYTRVILRGQPQYRTSQGQTSNHSQYQNPQIIPDVRHPDMRMDINGMSYEELLALEERIGIVNTGVNTSELSKFVKKVICCGEQDEAERCVICQEQYADADAKGQLKCGHEYHFSCIGRWMEEQAVCPICRQRAAHFEQ